MKLIIANWKLHPTTANSAVRLAKISDKKNVVITPPFPYLSAVGNITKKAELGAQDLFWETEGAYTGEVSARQLKNLGVKYVIVGHSERREHFGETDGMINKKVMAAFGAGIKPILCVGENSKIHRRGEAAVMRFVGDQLKKDLSGKTSNYSAKNLTIAYEPIWAIGSKRSDKPEDAARICKYIKKQTGAGRVIYGGSVDGKNIGAFLSRREIEGVLVGGASVSESEFRAILKNAESADKSV